MSVRSLVYTFVDKRADGYACFLSGFDLAHLRRASGHAGQVIPVRRTLFTVQICLEQLAVLAIASWVVAGHFDHVENARRLVEDLVHLLQ